VWTYEAASIERAMNKKHPGLFGHSWNLEEQNKEKKRKVILTFKTLFFLLIIFILSLSYLLRVLLNHFTLSFIEKSLYCISNKKFMEICSGFYNEIMENQPSTIFHELYKYHFKNLQSIIHAKINKICIDSDKKIIGVFSVSYSNMKWTKLLELLHKRITK
jgi:hypothetical protein